MLYKDVDPFNSYSILLTEQCSLKCSYCYEVMSKGHSNKRMTQEIALQTLYFIFNQSINTTKKIDIGFFGGEPMLEIDLIDFFCTKGKELAYKYHKHISFNIITNATIMNGKVFNILNKHKDSFSSCQLSIDGKKNIQDLYRKTKNGSGSFDTIQKNIPMFKELFGKKLNIHGVLNSKTIHSLYESYQFFRNDWGIDKLWFLPAKDNNFDELHVDIYDKQMELIYNDITEKIKDNIDEIYNYAPLDRCISNGSDKPCGAGDTYCCITTDGHIYPCHHFYFIDNNKHTLLGDVYVGVKSSKKLIWNKYDNKDMIGCNDCDHLNCYRCIAENYEKYENPFKQIKDYHCDFMKIDQKYQHKLKQILENNINTDNENNIPDFKPDKLIETYVLHITKECNCQCLYCYENDKTSKYSWEEIKILLDEIIEKNNHFNLEFLGGEPCLSLNIIKKTIEYLKSFSNINVENYLITSNGTIVDGELINIINNNNVKYSISLDGTPLMNVLRPLKNGYNSFELILNNIINLLNSVNVNKISIHMVTHPYNIGYLYDGIKLLYNLGIRHIGIGTIESTINIDNDYCNVFSEELRYISDNIKNGNFEGLKIDLFESLKPITDKRYYLKKDGKTILESYGRSDDDIINNYGIDESYSDYSDMIYKIRENAYLYHNFKNI